MKRLYLYLMFACMSFLLLGCAAEIVHREGKELIAQGDLEAGVEKLQAAAKQAPSNIQFRKDYLVERELAVNRLLEQARAAQLRGVDGEVRELLQRLRVIDPNHPRLVDFELNMDADAKLKFMMANAQSAWNAGDTAGAMDWVRRIQAERPGHKGAQQLLRVIQEEAQSSSPERSLDAKLGQLITLEFAGASVKQVFEIFAKAAGVNFIFDRDVPQDLRTTIYLRNTTVKNALDLILATNQLEKRILNSNTVLLYQNNPGKQREYQELSVKTFFLNNADAKTVGNTIKAIVKTKDLIVDEQQNMLILRDSLDAIRLAERLVALHDLPQPEVMLEVEILEIKRSSLLKLGVQWPGQLTLTPLATDSNVGVTLADLRNLPSNRTGATLGSGIINANKTDGDVKLLANPRIRTRAKETAKIMIGERLPNISTTSTATGFVAENIQYIDVGLKLEVQPVIYPNDEVAIKLNLEVSSVGNQITSKAGSTAYQIGTRNASTVLRLKDGENQILAGLINDEERASGNRVPGLGELPVLGRLFGTQTDDNQKTEIVLSITPRLVRNISTPTSTEMEFESGTEMSVRVPVNLKRGTTSLPSNLAATNATHSSDAGELPKNAAPPLPAELTTPGIAWRGPGKVGMDKDFVVEVFVAPGTPLRSVPYSIGYDPEVLNLVTMIPGAFLKQDGKTTSYSNRFDRERGQASALETRTDNTSVAQPGQLATLVFRPLKPSTGTQIRLSDLSGVDSVGKQVTIDTRPAFTLVISEE